MQAWIAVRGKRGTRLAVPDTRNRLPSIKIAAVFDAMIRRLHLPLAGKVPNLKRRLESQQILK